MLQRVASDQLRPGMYVAGMDCSWVRNPFWRSSFLIREQGQIALLLEAGIETVTIDDAKGLGLPRPAGGPTPCAAPEAPETRLPAGRERRTRPRPTRTELDLARDIVDRSKAAVTAMFGEARLGRAVEIAVVSPLVDEIAASVARDPSAMIKVTRLKTKNEYTYMHSVAVCALMINLARHLGLPAEQLRDIGLAGLLHDIGKMATPCAVLDKPGALTDAEFRIMRTHPEQGHALICGSPGVSALALDVCLHHHERVDGRGYPHGLTAGQLSIHARMGAICDVYDAITSDRPYKRAWSPNEALARMLEWQGHFDPHLLDVFVSSLGIAPTGALVRLHSNRLAVVLPPAHGCDPLTPPVRVFYAVEESQMLPPADVETGEDGDPILRLERGSYWFGDEWPVIRAALTA